MLPFYCTLKGLDVQGRAFKRLTLFTSRFNDEAQSAMFQRQ